MGASSASPVVGGFDWGFNFRSTAGFVVDPAGMSYVSANNANPPTGEAQDYFYGAGGSDEIRTRVGDAACNAGWTSLWTNNRGRDINATYDPRVAGYIWTGNDKVSTPNIFRVDIPDGSGVVRIHWGALYEGVQGRLRLRMYDGDELTGVVLYDDRTSGMSGGVVRSFDTTFASAADWVAAVDAGNVYLERTFVNGRLTVHFPYETTTEQGNISHLRVIG